MTCSICSQLKLEPDLQQDRKPFKRKIIFPNNVSNLGTKMVFQKKKYKASDLGLFFFMSIQIIAYQLLAL